MNAEPVKVNVLNEGYSQVYSEDSAKDGFYCQAVKGHTLTDINGNLYIDMAMAGGSAIFGHQAVFIQQAISEQLQNGSVFTVANPITHQFAQALNKLMPWFNDYVFCSTGSEATMRAMRIARAYNNKNKVAIFSGCWHGSHDLLLVEEDYGYGEQTRAKLKSAGTPKHFLDDILFLPYNVDKAFSELEANVDDLSLIMIEPTQGSNPRDDIGPFLQKLRTFADQNQVLLCFDEVITGARLAPGGAQQFFDVYADLATYGKALGGGLPLGIVAGKSEVMAVIRDSDNPVFMGGTFSANPLTMAAGLSVANYIDSHRELYLQLERLGQRLRQGVNDYCQQHNINAHMIGVGSLCRLVFCKQKVRSRRDRDEMELAWSKQADFYQKLKKQGVYVGGNRINFISSQHNEDNIDKVIDAYCTVLNEYQQQGLLPGEKFFGEQLLGETDGQ